MVQAHSVAHISLKYSPSRAYRLSNQFATITTTPTHTAHYSLHLGFTPQPTFLAPPLFSFACLARRHFIRPQAPHLVDVSVFIRQVIGSLLFCVSCDGSPLRPKIYFQRQTTVPSIDLQPYIVDPTNKLSHTANRLNRKYYNDLFRYSSARHNRRTCTNYFCSGLAWRHAPLHRQPAILNKTQSDILLHLRSTFAHRNSTEAFPVPFQPSRCSAACCIVVYTSLKQTLVRQ